MTVLQKNAGKLKIWLILGLLILSVLTQFLWLSHPGEVVFDEVHFGKFITAYCCTGEHFFDIHPPHAKLLIAGTAWLGGYRGGFDFKNIGQIYDDNIPVFALRFLPALAGAMLPLIIFSLLRRLKVSFYGALAGGLLIAFDNALTVQSRIISLDSILLAATFGSIVVFLAAQSRRDWLGAVMLALSGILAGLAMGVKFTGLAALGLIGVMVLVKIFQNLKTRLWINWIVYGILIFLSAIFVYLAGWWVHFTLLPLPGSGDVWHEPAGRFVHDTIALHHKMLGANYNLGATHPYSSSWWEWPLMKTPIFYWSGGEGEVIYFIGNTVVWWGGSLLFLVALFNMLFSRKFFYLARILWIPLLGWMISLGPLMQVPRALFMYHYLTPLIFSIVVGLIWLDQVMGGSEQEKTILRLIVYSNVIAAAFFGFLFYLSVTYGLPISDFMRGIIAFFEAWGRN